MSFHQPTAPDGLDESLRVLADGHCRALLRHFAGAREETAPLGELARALSGRVGEGVDRVALRLHHATLPRLADLGVVDYDPDAGTVRYRGHPELEALAERLAPADGG